MDGWVGWQDVGLESRLEDKRRIVIKYCVEKGPGVVGQL